MHGIGPFLLLSSAVFAGAFVSSLAGFAFSAVAGGILLHVLPPIEALPLMMACRVGGQGTNPGALRKDISGGRNPILGFAGPGGGSVSAPLLHKTGTRTRR